MLTSGVLLLSLLLSVCSLRIAPKHKHLSGDGNTLQDFIENHIKVSGPLVTEDDLNEVLYEYLIAEEGHTREKKRPPLPERHIYTEPIPKAQDPKDREVAVLIHTYDGDNARKFWPLVLEGTARNLMADAPPGFKLYFAHDGVDDISCLTKDLPVPVTELKFGEKELSPPAPDGPSLGLLAGNDYGWADSLIKTLEQLQERWIFFVQEDTAFPVHVDSSILERIVDFAVMRDAHFLSLTRKPTPTFFTGRNLFEDGWQQTDLNNMTFFRMGGKSRFAVNHNIALIDTKWWLERAKKARAALDGGQNTNELYEHLVNMTDEEREDKRQNIYATVYNSPFSNGKCDVRGARHLNEWGCIEGKVPSEPSEIGLDMVVAIARHGETTLDHWWRNYKKLGINTLQRLGLPVDEKEKSGFMKGSEICTRKTQ